MKNNKNGFTLIELLAVIVILAIIALIATPIVLNIISDTNEQADLRSADFYLDALELSIAQSTLDGQNVVDGTYNILENGNICLEYENTTCKEELKVEVKGKTPKDGTITIGNGQIKKVSFKLEEKQIYINSKGELAYRVWTHTDTNNDGIVNKEDLITIGTESFYVYSNENDIIKALARYNLMVGNEYDSDWNVIPLTNPTGLQDEAAKGWYDYDPPYYGTTAFSNSSTYKGSIVEGYVEAYKTKLEEMGATFIDDTTGEHEMESASGVRLISFKELKTLGCSDYTCICPRGFLTETSYWSGSPINVEGNGWIVDSDGYFDGNAYGSDNFYGVRPVIIISSSEI